MVEAGGLHGWLCMCVQGVDMSVMPRPGFRSLDAGLNSHPQRRSCKKEVPGRELGHQELSIREWVPSLLVIGTLWDCLLGSAPISGERLVLCW